MAKHLVVVGLSVAAWAASACSPQSPPSSSSQKPTQVAAASPVKPAKHHAPVQIKKDSRRRGPSIHRAGPAELAVRNRVALAESQKLLAHHVRPELASVPATAWVSLGPTDAANEFNSVVIPGVDSGRPNNILADPRDPNVVYMAVSGGGVWKTFNFLGTSGPTWSPLTDLQPNLAIGALAMDSQSPDTLFIGNGDFVDTAGNTVMKSTNGGSTWSAPIALSGHYPAPNNFAASVGSVRAIGARGSQVLVATDVGLFTSSNGGLTFALTDLPNTGGTVLAESVWSVLETGGGQWVAAGVRGCDVNSGPAPLIGVDPGDANNPCTNGNNGEIWHSNDGVSWTLSTIPLTTTTGRLTLAVGPTTNPATTVVYAYVGAVDGSKTLGFWRSMDGGKTFVDATGTLANPSLLVTFSDNSTEQDCADIDLGHDQSWYNQAIVVDPTNPDHVLAGGNLCGARTLNGTSASPTWELISHWLNEADVGKTANGRLPYVHADWHTALSVVQGTTVRTFAGSDGGIFSSTDVFNSAVKAESVTWAHANRGLVTHLVYAIGSGDPATANPFVLFAGLQDNGTRFRLSPNTPSVFNQPVGGDGIGATVHVATTGTTFWGSVEFSHVFCQPANGDCSDGNNWNEVEPTLHTDDRADDGDDDARPGRKDADHEDAEPFFVHYSNVETDTTGQSVLTHSNGQIFVSSLDAQNNLTWTAISQDLAPNTNTTGTGFDNVTASRNFANLYGAAGNISAQPFFISLTGNTPSTWTVTQPVFPTGTTSRLTGPSSIDFPPTLPVGKTPGQVFIGSFTGVLNDTRVPPPDNKGRLWRTNDGGQTWTSIVGNDPAHQLPNVAIFVAKYDPITATTIYAGTEIGVYITTDDGATWNRMGEGFPVVPVRDIYVAKNQDFIRVATYGRGIWEIFPSAAANQGALGNGDFDRNIEIDWIDLAAMSTRLGTTPAVTTPPFYTWIMDVTANSVSPPPPLIDDADLTALLANFGGHP